MPNTRTRSIRRHRRRRLYVADSLKQTRRLGELHHAIAAGLSETGRVQIFAELGQIVAG
jgi:ornithine cyclodeaminase